ncbi:hypothetical protein FGO68_gene11168 [Halteria grandinella]|uniref:Serine carboxypeptidase n=1 Tax=Halteria grandinella TaxID=5974 RepID=A0A8J8NNW9_HALGN|nr:hypothetical protein FGO68_gene11168 [Halteria grandinella]
MIIGFFLISLLYLAQAARQSDLVDSLPDQPALKSKWYSGYYNVSNTARQYHYMFVESQGTPNTDPIIYWFDGGPGISSMVGLFSGIGPLFFTHQSLKFAENPYTWNLHANLMFIENPVGVGFSYVPTDKDTFNNDWNVQEDLFSFTQQFFADFPEYLSNPLYLAGNSYGGIYAPFLGYAIHQYNLIANFSAPPKQHYNLKGFIIANGGTDWKYDFLSETTPYTYAAFNIFPESLLQEYLRLGCTIKNPLIFKGWEPVEECIPIINRMAYLHNNGVDIYDLLRMPYKAAGSMDKKDQGFSIYQETQNSPNALYLADYLNRKDVREALHIPDYVPDYPVNSQNIQVLRNFQWHVEGSGFIQEILAKYGLYKTVHIFGDTDGQTTLFGVRQWIKSTHWKTTSEWTPWINLAGNMGGYTQTYENVYTLLTMRAVGHSAVYIALPQIQDIVFKFIRGASSPVDLIDI